MLRHLNRVFRRTGYKIETQQGLDDFRSGKGDFLCNAYKANRDYLIEAQLSTCRWYLIGTSYSYNSQHPYVETLKQYDRGLCTSYDDSPLREFFNGFQPENAFESLGIRMRLAIESPLSNISPLGLLEPWVNGSIRKFIKTATTKIEKENLLHGAKLTHKSGGQYFGPVSEEKGELEFRRLVNVFENIRRDGYQRNAEADGDIEGLILEWDGDYAVCVKKGQHRIGALAALGYKSTTIRIIQRFGLSGLIRRKDARSWPGVVSGSYTMEEAVDIFERVFEGIPASQV